MIAREEKAMDLALVVGIISRSSLETVEKRLEQLAVRRITVTHVRGYGQYADFLSRDHLVEQVKIEIFAARDRARSIASAMLDAACANSTGDEIVVILPVETVLAAAVA